MSQRDWIAPSFKDLPVSGYQPRSTVVRDSQAARDERGASHPLEQEAHSMGSSEEAAVLSGGLPHRGSTTPTPQQVCVTRGTVCPLHSTRALQSVRVDSEI